MFLYCPRRAVLALGSLMLAVAPVQAGECEPEWSALEGPGANGLGGPPNALAVFDDGSGPALYAAGFFPTAGGVNVENIAKWDGTSWAALPGTGGGNGGTIDTLTVFDDGTGPALYAGGGFTSAGGVAANRIAKWDGTSWSALDGPGGNGMNNTVFALAVFDDGTGPALYAAGSFTTAAGTVVNNIARWDGSDWSALEGPAGNGVSSGTFSTISSLTVYDDGTGAALYAGGNFTSAGGVAANNIARWDGSNWSALEGPSDNGANAGVGALAVFDDGAGPALYAGGGFTSAGGVAAVRIAKWDGTEWSALEGPSGNGMSFLVFALQVFDDGEGEALYAAGNFISAGGVTVNDIAKWDGANWSPLVAPSGIIGVEDGIFDLAVFDDGSGPALYASGRLSEAGGITTNNIARWAASCATPPCPADVTGNGTVDLDDLDLVLSNFGQTTTEGDTNNDGFVNLDDLDAVLAAFGTDCP